MDGKKPHILLTTDVTIYDYDDYLEWCSETDNDPASPDSSEFWDWVIDEVQLNLDVNRENIKYSKYNNRPCLITGQLGLWNGRPNIIPVKCDNLLEAINKCVSGNSIADYDVLIREDEPYITVHAKHHDGTNVLEIHVFKDDNAVEQYFKAKDAYDYDEADTIEIKDDWFEPIEWDKIF